MKVMTFADLWANFAVVLDQVIDDCEVVAVARDGKPSVVIISLDEYNNLKEHLHLLGSQANAQALLDSMSQAKAT